MFSVNDVVMYGSNGICRISSIETRNLTGEEIEYFILIPINNDKNTFYVPSDHHEALNKMCPVCSKEEAHYLIQHIGEEKVIWIENETERKEKLKLSILLDTNMTNDFRQPRTPCYNKVFS